MDCSVRRRPFGPTPFLRHAGKLVSGSSRPADAQMLVGHTLQPYLQQLHSLRARLRSPTALAMRRAVRSVLARRALPSRTVPYPRAPCLTLAHRGPSSPYPSMSGGKSLILKRVADNRASCGQFPFQGVSKTATRSEMFEKPPLIRSQPTLERWLSTQSSSRPSRNVSKTATHQQTSAKREVFRVAFAF